MDPLARRLRAREAAAFAELVHAEQNRLFRIALAMTRNQEDARDILQTALMQAWRSIDSLQDDARLGGWLCRITTNAALMHLRGRRRRPELSVEDAEETFDTMGHRTHPVAPVTPTPEDQVTRARLAARIAELGAALPEGYREVWVLADVEHLSMEEIGETLGLAVPNVKTRLHRARLTLRKALADERGAA